MAWRKPANMNDWLRVIVNHWKKFFFPAVTVGIGVVISSLWIPREYSAQAIVEMAKDPALEEMGSSMIERNLERLRGGYSRLILGRAAIEQLIEDLGMTRGLAHTEDGDLTPEGQQAKNDMILDFQKRIRTFGGRRRDEIVISYTHPDREWVPKVVNRLVENYVQKAREELDAGIVAPKGFFDKKVAEMEREEQKWQKAKLDFETRHPAQLFKDPAAVEDRLTELKDQLKSVDHELTLVKSRRRSLEEWMKDQPKDIIKEHFGPNPEVLKIGEKLQVLETELENHLYVLNRTEEHPGVKRTRLRIAELEQQLNDLDDQVPQGEEREPNVELLKAGKEVETLTSHIGAKEEERLDLLTDIDDTEALKRNFFAKRSEYQNIERALDEASSQLKRYKDELRGAMIAVEIEKSQRGVRLRIEERAEEPNRPSKPTIVLILGTALFLGGGVGAVLVVLAELLTNSLTSIDQAVDDLKLPVLGAVNEIVSPSDILRAKIFGRGVYPVLALVMLAGFVISLGLANMSLSDPYGYEKIINHPKQYLEQTLFGG